MPKCAARRGEVAQMEHHDCVCSAYRRLKTQSALYVQLGIAR
jgi:hypothetical protein